MHFLFHWKFRCLLNHQTSSAHSWHNHLWATCQMRLGSMFLDPNVNVNVLNYRKITFEAAFKPLNTRPCLIWPVSHKKRSKATFRSALLLFLSQSNGSFYLGFFSRLITKCKLKTIVNTNVLHIIFMGFLTHADLLAVICIT